MMENIDRTSIMLMAILVLGFLLLGFFLRTSKRHDLSLKFILMGIGFLIVGGVYLSLDAFIGLDRTSAFITGVVLALVLGISVGKLIRRASS